MPNLTDTDYKKMNIDESFKANTRDDLKAIYKIKLGNENAYHKRRAITKILKLDKIRLWNNSSHWPTFV